MARCCVWVEPRMTRHIEAELLDELPADAPAAIRSRGDLRRVNWWMGHARILRRALGDFPSPAPRKVVELGAGDGTLLLDLAARWPGHGTRVTAVLVDRQSLVSDGTRRAFAALGWDVQPVQADVSDWLERPGPPVDWILANLFLHHLSADRLRRLLPVAAVRSQVFIACEPRRAPLPLAATRLLRLIGCNAVTRHDARVSVRAGFMDGELSALWPSDSRWRLSERPAGLFSHLFMARRR